MRDELRDAFTAAYWIAKPDASAEDIARAYKAWRNGRSANVKRYSTAPGLIYQVGMHVGHGSPMVHDEIGTVVPVRFGVDDDRAIGTVVAVQAYGAGVHTVDVRLNAIEFGNQVHRQAEELARDPDRATFDGLTNALGSWRCAGAGCPEREPVRAATAPKCYTCDRPMSAAAPGTSVQDTIEALQQRVAAAMGLPPDLLMPLPSLADAEWWATPTMGDKLTPMTAEPTLMRRWIKSPR